VDDLQDIIARHNRSQDALVATFETHLREIVLRAQGRTIARLEARLSITDGVVDSTAGNMVILRNAGTLFMDEMNKAGYQRLVTAFVGEFRQTLPFLQETIEVLGKQAGQKWGPKLGFTAKDLSLLNAVQANTATSLTGAIEAVAGQAITRGLFGVAGLRFGALVETLTDKLEMSIGRARSVADTGMSVFYATASDRTFQIISKDLPEQVLRFRYSGPVDKLERLFCRHLTDVEKAYTREQIGKMNNHQFPVGSVFVTRGGWNCRHHFVLDTHELEVEEAA
jgi:hypothetical protein